MQVQGHKATWRYSLGFTRGDEKEAENNNQKDNELPPAPAPKPKDGATSTTATKKPRKPPPADVDAQLCWMASVVVYVTRMYNATKLHGSKKKTATVPTLATQIPLLGPRFTPPTYLQTMRRKGPRASISPGVSYLKPLNIVHPFYYPSLARCAKCGTTKSGTGGVSLKAWAGTAPRSAYGVAEDEFAYGVQYECENCGKESRASGGKKEGYCCSTTNPEFWKGYPPWEIPSESSLWLPSFRLRSQLITDPAGIPRFFKRCAVTQGLFDLVIEYRPDSTSEGIARHIKRMSKPCHCSPIPNDLHPARV